MSFPERFELLDVLREGEIQTFRVRERATGRTLEAHFAATPELLRDQPSAIDQGRHEGRCYVVTAVAGDLAPLNAAGAWRIQSPQSPQPPQPVQQPAAPLSPAAEPGDFTRMFQLRQAPRQGLEPASEPASKPTSQPTPVGVAAAPGQFTRAFQRPVAAPPAASPAASAPGEPGEFTRMFQQPAPPAARPPQPQPDLSPRHVPPPPARASQPRAALVVIVLLALCAIAVLVLLRTLY